MSTIEKEPSTRDTTDNTERQRALRQALTKLSTALKQDDPARVDVAIASAYSQLASVLPRKAVIEVTDLTELWDVAADPIRPELGERSDGKNLLYTGRIHWLAGEPGGGKSWVALSWCLEQARAGKKVLFVDMESDSVTITTRLRALGIKREELSMIPYLRIEWSPDQMVSASVQILDMVASANPTLVVFDGLATALAMCGLDENANRDVTAYTAAVLRPIANAGPAVVVIDHLGKSSAEVQVRRYARGASAKLADASGVSYVLETVTGFSADKSGLANLRVGKDRNGQVGAMNEVVAEIAFTPGDGNALVLDVRPPEPGKGDGKFLPTVLMDKISAALERDGELTAGEASAVVGKSNWEKLGKTIRTLLEKHDYISVEKRGTATIMVHVKRFVRDQDEAALRAAEFGEEIDDTGPF